LEFYRDGLGLPTQGIIGKEFEHGAVAFFDLQCGLKLAIFPREDIALDCYSNRNSEGTPSIIKAQIHHFHHSYYMEKPHSCVF
jgi:hypothetical protein